LKEVNLLTIYRETLCKKLGTGMLAGVMYSAVRGPIIWRCFGSSN